MANTYQREIEKAVTIGGETKVEKFTVTFPRTISDAVALWGKEATDAMLVSTSPTVRAQAAYNTLRTRKRNPLSSANAAKEMAKWVYEVPREQVSVVDRLTTKADDLSVDETKALMARLEAKLAKKDKAA